MTVRYENATTPDATRGRALLHDSQTLESLAESVNESLKLPYDIPLIASECGEANDYWNPTDKNMVMCYEDVTESLDIFADDPDPGLTAQRVAIASFYHELGHMAIDIYDLPATGREEDVADQLAAWWLLSPNPDGSIDDNSVQAAKDLAREFKIYGALGDPPAEDTFADVHTLNEARMYNFECWIYGSDPSANADIITAGLLPASRADTCNYEYNKLARAWSSLLDTHLK